MIRPAHSSDFVLSTSLEINHKSMDVVKKSQAGGGVAVKIEHAVYQSAKMFGRHFDEKDEILSHITRQSIDVLKVRGNPVPLQDGTDTLSHRKTSGTTPRRKTGF